MASEMSPDEDSDETLVRHIAEDRDKHALTLLMSRCARKRRGT